MQPPFLFLRFRIELLLQLPFSVTFPPVKRQVWKIRRFSRPVNIKMIFPLNMVRAKRRPFQTIWLLLCANVCRHSIHGIVMQCILLHGTFLPAGEDLGIRESIVQRPQPL